MPISPKDVQARKNASIPQQVFDVFDELIARSWDGSRAVVMQGEVASRVAAALDISRQQVFDRHLLDVEGAYKKAGWKVDYDKPGYNESYEANFTFRK